MRKPIEELIDEYQKSMYVAAYSVCGNAEDAHDVVQDTFIRYYTSKKEFNDEQHLKAWLLRVAVNRAKDINRSFWHKVNTLEYDVGYEEYSGRAPVFEDEKDSELFSAVMKLPYKYRIVIHLFYYEDMSSSEIAGVLRISEANVRVRLTRGRKMLKERLKEEWQDD